MTGTTASPTYVRSHIEQLLSLRQSSCADHFSNEHTLECPLWARGAYGGQLIAQSLLAAYETVGDAFVAHSIHCHFLNAANVELSVVFDVHRVRDGRSFTTRVIHARQDNKLILLATVSFTLESTRGHILQHNVPFPSDERLPDDEPEVAIQSAAGQGGQGQPCDCVRSTSVMKGLPSQRRYRQWVKARGKIQETSLDASRSPDGSSTRAKLSRRDNHHAHLAALAYMTDNYFLGTVFRAHDASRFSDRPYPIPTQTVQGDAADVKAWRSYFDRLADEEKSNSGVAPNNNKHVTMLASLDHTIFFHQSRGFRADEWLLNEAKTPWADHERGVVVGRIWNHEGILVATCIQEGVVRLAQLQGGSRL